MLYRTSACYEYGTCFKYTCLRWVKDKNPNEFVNAMEQQERQFEELRTCLKNTILRLRVENQVSIMFVTPSPVDLFKKFRVQPLPRECLDPQALESSSSPFQIIAQVLVEDMHHLHAFLRRLHDHAEQIWKERTSQNSCKFIHALSYFDKYLECLKRDPGLSRLTLSSISDESRDYHVLGITNEDGTMPHPNLFSYLKNYWDEYFMSILDSIVPFPLVKSTRPSLRQLSKASASSLRALSPSFDLPQAKISSKLPIVASCPSVPVIDFPCLTSTVQFREVPNLMSSLHALIPSGDMLTRLWGCITDNIKPYYVVFKPECWDYSCLDLPGLYYNPDVIPRHNHQLLMPAMRYLGSELESVLNAVKSMPQSFERYVALVMVYTRTSLYVLVLNEKKGSQSLTYPFEFSKMCDRCHLLEALREVEDFMYTEYVYIFHTLSGAETKNLIYSGMLKSVIAQRFLEHAGYVYGLCRVFKGPPRLLMQPSTRAGIVAARRSPSPTRFDPRPDSPYSVFDLSESLCAIPVPGNRHAVGQLLPPHAFGSQDIDSYKSSEFNDLKDKVQKLTDLVMSKFK